MSGSSSESRRQADLDNNTEWEPVTEVASLQNDMMNVLRRSSVDPISYVGLEYCSAKRCGRAGCSEACWYGTVRRRVANRQAACQLLRQHGGKLYDVVAFRTRWDRRRGDLHEANIGAGKNLVRRGFDRLAGYGLVAVGSFKVRPSGFNSWSWHFETHIIVAGAKREPLADVFREVPRRNIHDVVVRDVKNVEDAVDDALNCNALALLSESFRLRQRQEFYAWLLNMKIGSRLIRYGCDENFGPLA
jgi:hypothetical protein